MRTAPHGSIGPSFGVSAAAISSKVLNVHTLSGARFMSALQILSSISVSALCAVSAVAMPIEPVSSGHKSLPLPKTSPIDSKKLTPQVIEQEESQYTEPTGSTPDEKVTQPLGVTVAYQAFSQYAPFGIVIQDQGVSSQPFINVRYRIYDDKSPNSFLSSATVFATSWSDFSSNTILSSPSGPYPNWTETDLIVGFNAVFYKRWISTFNFTAFQSPAGGYGPEGFGAWTRGTLLFDDSRLLSPAFSLQPQFSLVYSLPAPATISLEPSAFLFEPGLTPTYNFWSKTNYPATLSLPVRLGLGYRYYADSVYGYTSLGPQLSIRLPQFSGKKFSTNLNIGYLYYNLGSTAANFAANKSSTQNVFNVGLYVNF